MGSKILYMPTQRALEYSRWAANLYFGCPHRCLYCYNKYDQYKRYTEEQFHNSPGPKKQNYQFADIGRLLYQLERDCRNRSSAEGPIFLSFTTDVYQPLEEELRLTRDAIEIIKANGLNVTILTKSPLAIRDFDLLDENDAVGATLTFNNDEDSLFWESNAPLPARRFEMLREAKRQGPHTWVSMEPVIRPQQTLEMVREHHDIIDEFKVGKLNDPPLAPVKYEERLGIDWGDFARRVEAELIVLGKEYMIKEDLREYNNPSNPEHYRLFNEVLESRRNSWEEPCE